MTQWYALLQDEQLGPMPDGELVDLHEQGVISDDTLVWAEHLSDWQPFNYVPELLAAAAARLGDEDGIEDEDGATLMMAEGGADWARLLQGLPNPAPGPEVQVTRSQSKIPALPRFEAPPRVEQAPPLFEAPPPRVEQAPPRVELPAPEITPPRMDSGFSLDALPPIQGKPGHGVLGPPPLLAEASRPPMPEFEAERSIDERFPDAPLPVDPAQPPVEIVLDPPPAQSSGSNTPLIIGLVALVLGLGGAAAAFILLADDPPPLLDASTPVSMAPATEIVAPVTVAPATSPPDAGPAPKDAAPADAMVFPMLEIPDPPKAQPKSKAPASRAPASRAPATRPPKASPRTKAPARGNLPRQLGRADMIAVIKANAGRLKSCAAADPKAKGTFTVAVTIKRNGAVGRAKVVTGRLRGSPAASCIEKQVKGYRFKPFAGDPMRLQIPFRI